MPAQSQGQTKVAIDPTIIEKIDQIRPSYMDRTTFINLQLDSCITLGKPNVNEVLPLNKAVNKEKDVNFSLRAEEAHVSEAAFKSLPKATKEIPGNLFGHEDLIRAYWKAKPKTKTAAAWKLLMTELTKIQDTYGDSVLRSQLELAEAKGW